MSKINDRGDLRSFAEKKIAAEKYPNDYHIFHEYKCETCGRVPFSLDVEYHTGSKKGNFKGVIHGTCGQCGTQKTLFSFTGSHRTKERTEEPKCLCGNDTFHVANLERIEGDEGLMGFFDEGVIVGKCAKCGRNQAIVFTD